MNYKKEYLKVNKEIRKLEQRKEKVENGKNINHILHLLLSILTGGLWLIVWIALALNFDSRSFGLDGKLADLYETRDEIELEMKGNA